MLGLQLDPVEQPVEDDQVLVNSTEELQAGIQSDPQSQLHAEF